MLALRTPNGHALGWKRDLPDPRDLRLTFTEDEKAAALPPSIDLRTTGYVPPVEDQYNINACTQFATGGLFQYDENRQKVRTERYSTSKMFTYWNTRELEGTTSTDAGATLRNSIKAMVQWGAPAWHNYPYYSEYLYVAPPPSVYFNASHHKVSSYLSVDPTLQAMKTCLVQGYPFSFGTAVFMSFDGIGPDGNVPIPNIATEQLLGGHAMYCVGYDDVRQVLTVRNSWGVFFGDHGDLYFPYPYIASIGFFDLWTVRQVTTP